MQTADVVIVGGGIVGSSIAYHLAASVGGVRAQFSTSASIPMSLYAIPFYAKFEANLGCPCDCRPQGYLFCTAADKQMACLRTNYTLPVKTGVKEVRLLAADELQMIDAPWLSPSRFAEGRLIQETAVL